MGNTMFFVLIGILYFIFLYCLYNILYLQSWGPSFNFSVWYVGLFGDDEPSLGKLIHVSESTGSSSEGSVSWDHLCTRMKFYLFLKKFRRIILFLYRLLAPARSEISWKNVFYTGFPTQLFPTPCNDSLPVKMCKILYEKLKVYIIIIAIIFIYSSLLVTKCLQWQKDFRERETIRLCLKHFREQNYLEVSIRQLMVFLFLLFVELFWDNGIYPTELQGLFSQFAQFQSGFRICFYLMRIRFTLFRMTHFCQIYVKSPWLLLNFFSNLNTNRDQDQATEFNADPEPWFQVCYDDLAYYWCIKNLYFL